MTDMINSPPPAIRTRPEGLMTHFLNSFDFLLGVGLSYLDRAALAKDEQERISEVKLAVSTLEDQIKWQTEQQREAGISSLLFVEELDCLFWLSSEFPPIKKCFSFEKYSSFEDECRLVWSIESLNELVMDLEAMTHNE